MITALATTVNGATYTDRTQLHLDNLHKTHAEAEEVEEAEPWPESLIAEPMFIGNNFNVVSGQRSALVGGQLSLSLPRNAAKKIKGSVRHKHTCTEPLSGAAPS